MKYPQVLRFVEVVAFALGLLVGSRASAGTAKTIALRLHNDTPDTPMTCEVHRVVTNSSGSDVETRLARWSVTPKNERAASVQNTPQDFTLSVSRIGRRIDRTDIYPRLKLTCELAGQNSRTQSPAWDDRTNSFAGHRFLGSCRSGAYCSVRFERK